MIHDPFRICGIQVTLRHVHNTAFFSAFWISPHIPHVTVPCSFLTPRGYEQLWQSISTNFLITRSKLYCFLCVIYHTSAYLLRSSGSVAILLNALPHLHRYDAFTEFSLTSISGLVTSAQHSLHVDLHPFAHSANDAMYLLSVGFICCMCRCLRCLYPLLGFAIWSHPVHVSCCTM